MEIAVISGSEVQHWEGNGWEAWLGNYVYVNSYFSTYCTNKFLYVLIHDWENIWQMYFFGFYSFAFYLMLLIDFFNFNRFFFVIEFFS